MVFVASLEPMPRSGQAISCLALTATVPSTTKPFVSFVSSWLKISLAPAGGVRTGHFRHEDTKLTTGVRAADARAERPYMGGRCPCQRRPSGCGRDVSRPYMGGITSTAPDGLRGFVRADAAKRPGDFVSCLNSDGVTANEALRFLRVFVVKNIACTRRRPSGGGRDVSRPYPGGITSTSPDGGNLGKFAENLVILVHFWKYSANHISLHVHFA